MVILMHASVATAYFGLTWWAWSGATSGAARETSGHDGRSARGANIGGSPDMRVLTWPERLLLLLTWLAHGLLLVQTMFSVDGLQFGFALALSATMWLAVAVYWVESLYFGLASMRLLVLPIAGVCVMLPTWFPGAVVTVALRNPALELHLAVALAAYGLLTIAAIHALLMAALDRWLHGRVVRTEGLGQSTGNSLWSRLQRVTLGHLPPLMTMERLLFRLVAAGFVLLTLTLLSGFVFSEEVFGRAFRFEHKTVFAVMSWLLFGGLLFGRVVYGWRGRTALRWTLAGFVSVLLAYVGTRFVLEVILHRL